MPVVRLYEGNFVHCTFLILRHSLIARGVRMALAHRRIPHATPAHRHTVDTSAFEEYGHRWRHYGSRSLTGERAGVRVVHVLQPSPLTHTLSSRGRGHYFPHPQEYLTDALVHSTAPHKKVSNILVRGLANGKLMQRIRN